jgi:hypothetical protein
VPYGPASRMVYHMLNLPSLAFLALNVPPQSVTRERLRAYNGFCFEYTAIYRAKKEAKVKYQRTEGHVRGR